MPARPLLVTSKIAAGSLLLLLTSLLNLSYHLEKPQVLSAASARISIPQLIEPFTATISAQSYLVYDLDSASVLLSLKPHNQLFPASLTKMMTALVAFDTYPEDTLFTYRSDLTLGSVSKSGPGDQFTLEDLLRLSLISSANDAALLLAESHPQGYSAFIEKMNSRAQSLGLQNTHFNNVTGLEDPNHYSSAYDLAIIARDLVARPVLASIVSTTETQIDSANNQHSYVINNTNLLLGQDGVEGVKTGTTENSGQNLVTLVNVSSHRVIIVVLKSLDRFYDTQQLISYLNQSIARQSI